GVTGERYGAEKAKSWEPEYKEVSDEDHAACVAERDEAEQLYETAVHEVGSFQGAPMGLNFDCPSCGTRLNYDRGNIRSVSE
ncbi:MAG: hypothetical protein GTO41_02975, partial [Burkholderiales bacterium]|nr:hypothetical protein [Burkholderiales bacterium]